MSKKRITLFVVLCFGFSYSYGQSCNWAKQGINIGHNSGQTGYSVATDSIGNVFLTGTFNDTVVFGTDTLYESNSIIANDIYLVKYDSSGNELWAKSSYQHNITQPRVVYVRADNQGNSYITGYYYGTIYFGSDSLFADRVDNAFYVKYDPAGNILWAKTASPSSPNCLISGHCGCPDNKGNSYLVGAFYDTVTFDTHTLYCIHSPTVFLNKYDINGNVIWAKNAVLRSLSSSAYSYSGSTDRIGNAYIVGYFKDTVSFGAYTLYSSSNYTNSGYGMFIAKYDTAGNVLWVKGASSASGTSNIYGLAISTDNNGNSYVTGYYQDTVYIGSDTISMPFNALENMFIAKYDSAGNFKWARTSTLKNDKSQADGYAVSVDNKENIYVSGHIDDTVTLGIDTLVEIHSVWYAPTFFAKYDSAGNLICAEGFNNGQEAAISADLYGNFYLGGFYDGFMYLQEDTLNTSEEAAFISKWKPCVDTNIITSITSISNKPIVLAFPNPSTGLFTLSLSNVSEKCNVEVYNVLGERVESEKVKGESEEIDLTSQPNGIYLYRVITENGGLVGEGKLIIQK